MVPVPFKVPEDMKGDVAGLAERTNLSEADIMRLAIGKGLPLLEKMFGEPVKKAA